MVLFLHNRYRTTGGEERVVGQLLTLVRERLGEPAELLERDSARIGRASAARGLLRGGLAPGEVGAAVKISGARVVHAHNLNPAFGWKALAAAREQGARIVLHLHQYRLVCANGVCFTAGRECTRCHGHNTLPGVVHNCRSSRLEGLAYAASLALWQRRLVAQADAVVVPSEFAHERLRALGAPLGSVAVHVLAPPVAIPDHAARADARDGERVKAPYALVVSRLAPEKGIDVAIEACALAGVELLVAGEGPQRELLQARAVGRRVRFLGAIDDDELERVRARARIAIVPSLSGETFGLAAAEAMAAGLPVVASRIGALPELVEDQALVRPGDPQALALAIGRALEDRHAGARGRARVQALCGPVTVAERLAEIYDDDRSDDNDVSCNA